MHPKLHAFFCALLLCASGCLRLTGPADGHGWPCDTDIVCDGDQRCVQGECRDAGYCDNTEDCVANDSAVLVCMDHACESVECISHGPGPDEGDCGNYRCGNDYTCKTRCEYSSDCVGNAPCTEGECKTPKAPECSGLASSECNGYGCDRATARCKTSCDPTSPLSCDNGYGCTSAGKCVVAKSGLVVRLGDLCSPGFADCIEGVCCTSSTAGGLTSGICTMQCTPAEVGEYCDGTIPCSAGPCSGNVCVPKTLYPIGHDCLFAQLCASGVCSASVCVPKTLYPIGHACTLDAVCMSDTCRGDICHGTADIGETCSQDLDCDNDHCVGDHCGGYTASGGDCTHDDDCASALCCFDVTQYYCGSRIGSFCGGFPGDDCSSRDDCPLSDECVDGMCTTLCTSDSDCHDSSNGNHSYCVHLNGHDFTNGHCSPECYSAATDCGNGTGAWACTPTPTADNGTMSVCN